MHKGERERQPFYRLIPLMFSVAPASCFLPVLVALALLLVVLLLVVLVVLVVRVMLLLLFFEGRRDGDQTAIHRALQGQAWLWAVMPICCTALPIQQGWGLDMRRKGDSKLTVSRTVQVGWWSLRPPTARLLISTSTACRFFKSDDSFFPASFF